MQILTVAVSFDLMGNLMQCKAYAKSAAVQGGGIVLIANDRHYYFNASTLMQVTKVD
jgi:hypothetical protein